VSKGIRENSHFRSVKKVCEKIVRGERKASVARGTKTTPRGGKDQRLPAGFGVGGGRFNFVHSGGGKYQSNVNNVTMDGVKQERANIVQKCGKKGNASGMWATTYTKLNCLRQKNIVEKNGGGKTKKSMECEQRGVLKVGSLTRGGGQNFGGKKKSFTKLMLSMVKSGEHLLRKTEGVGPPITRGITKKN